MRKIGLFGGTFDPPHIGHFIIADEVKHRLKLDEVWFIPTNVPPHKEKAISTNEQRRQMVERAIKRVDYFRIHSVELERTGPSYTLDTVLALKNKIPEATFYFIIGADMVEYLPNWYKIDELLNEITFVGVNRPGHEVTSPYLIEKLTVPMIDISSTDIKRRIKSKASFAYLVPNEVYSYIKEHRLYGYNSGG